MPHQLLCAYPREPDRYDELLTRDGGVRPHWRTLWNTLVAARPSEMRARLRSVARQIHDNGVTYNVYADPKGAVRPWDLDLLPLVIEPGEWAGIAAGVAQRARLLDRLLADLYGPQHVLADGSLPPALVFGHEGWLPACRDLRPRGDRWLYSYAADLARSPDGRWWVLNDRTQAPSGMGYALENRLVVSRQFPHAFRDARVQHLAEFFRLLRDGLSQHAVADEGPARIVLLTPGPWNETYFEHAYLAHYLGFPLVEGQDLAVREGRVYLKTLQGLQRVHAILRRLDDDYADPLELRGDSALGVAGLLESARRGEVVIANALGSGLLEGGALFGYLPRLAERLLGEPLALPSVATWWCGEPAALEDALANLDHVVVKPAFPRDRGEPIFGHDLDAAARIDLTARLRANPQQFLAQELVHLARAPVWDRHHPRRLRARVVGLRVFVCHGPDGYVVMPGGLTRVAGDADARVLSMQRGGASKDTWVPAIGQVSRTSLLRETIGPADIVRSGANLSSRIVENLYWFGRYAERCDSTARLLRVALGRLLEGTALEADADPLRGLLGEPQLASAEIPPGAPWERALVAGMLDGTQPASLLSCVGQLARVAFHLRERLSLDHLRALNRIEDRLKAAHASLPLEAAFSLLDGTVQDCTTLAGFVMDGMTRDQGWRFLSMGRRIERVHFLSRALRHAATTPSDAGLEWLLELADSIITYRSRYMVRPQRLPVFDLLLLEPANPRSVLFQLRGVDDFLRRTGPQAAGAADELLRPLLHTLAGLELASLVHGDAGAMRLATLLTGIGHAACQLSERLTEHYFSHVSEQAQASVSM